MKCFKKKTPELLPQSTVQLFFQQEYNVHQSLMYVQGFKSTRIHHQNLMYTHKFSQVQGFNSNDVHQSLMYTSWKYTILEAWMYTCELSM